MGRLVDVESAMEVFVFVSGVEEDGGLKDSLLDGDDLGSGNRSQNGSSNDLAEERGME